MLAFRTSGLLSASHTTWRGAGIRRSPVISMQILPLAACGGRYWQGCVLATEPLQPRPDAAKRLPHHASTRRVPVCSSQTDNPGLCRRPFLPTGAGTAAKANVLLEKFRNNSDLHLACISGAKVRANLVTARTVP